MLSGGIGALGVHSPGCRYRDWRLYLTVGCAFSAAHSLAGIVHPFGKLVSVKICGPERVNCHIRC